MPVTYEHQGQVLIAVMPAEELNRQEFEQHLNYVQGVFDRGKPFGMLVDARLSPGMSADNRRLVAEQKDAQFKQDPTRLVGTAVVLSSVLHRSVFSVISWLKSSSSPLRAFADVPTAAAWLNSLLGGSSVNAPTKRAQR
ncbi:MAG: hypothetical protein QM778_06410 [Myxococcales bacterium]